MGQPEQPVADSLRSTLVMNFCLCIVTRLMSHTTDLANFAVRMMPFRLLNWLVPSQQPTTETESQIPPEKQNLPTNSFAGTVWLNIKVIMVLAFVAVLMLLVIIFGWKAFQGNNVNNQSSSKCVLPAYPEHGTYMHNHNPGSKPGDSFGTLNLTVICLDGYRVLGTETVFCLNGTWSHSIPQCVRFCKLDTHISVQYHCIVSGIITGSRDCNVYEPLGTVVRPECNTPNYYPAGNISSMKCINGSWDQVVICALECGRIISKAADHLMIGGRSAKFGELPWHVGIYSKNTNPYLQICGGSIITNRVVVSAAHCFWDDYIKLLPVSGFAVAAGKIYRPWNNPRDVYAQKSDVKEIKIPDHYQGAATNFQDDIAVIILEIAFVYNSFVSPICYDFDVSFDRIQLQPGKLGKVAGWGLTETGNASQILKVVDLPYVGVMECFAVIPQTFREYITSDKICAGYGNGTALCEGDSGGGLAFPESHRGKDRFYLRGIVSTAARNDERCNSKTLTAFTALIKHQYFITDYI